MGARNGETNTPHLLYVYWGISSRGRGIVERQARHDALAAR
jgi:hypothetical protein